jgi:hypothetical protein
MTGLTGSLIQWSIGYIGKGELQMILLRDTMQIIDLFNFLFSSLGGVINDWRKHELGLEPISLSDGSFLLKTLEIPYTYCWSPVLVPKPYDWPANAGMVISLAIWFQPNY